MAGCSLASVQRRIVAIVALLWNRFRPKGPRSVETSILGVIYAWGNLCIAACIIVPARTVDGRTTRQPQQRDSGDDQRQLKISTIIDNDICSHGFALSCEYH